MHAPEVPVSLRSWMTAVGEITCAVNAAEPLDALIGVCHGVEVARGVAVNALLDDFSVQDADARLWPQTERIKAALALAGTAETAPEREALLTEAVRAIDGLRPYLATPTPGLWFDVLRADGTMVPQPSPTSSFYHIACAIAELRRWTESDGAASGVG